jgi:hypothetical protein
MNEQCTGCPWLDVPKKKCQRTAPRFCSVDEALNARSAPEIVPVPDQQDPTPAKIHRAA